MTEAQTIFAQIRLEETLSEEIDDLRVHYILILNVS
jgi:hypothetical protein